MNIDHHSSVVEVLIRLVNCRSSVWNCLGLLIIFTILNFENLNFIQNCVFFRLFDLFFVHHAMYLLWSGNFLLIWKTLSRSTLTRNSWLQFSLFMPYLLGIIFHMISKHAWSWKLVSAKDYIRFGYTGIHLKFVHNFHFDLTAHSLKIWHHEVYLFPPFSHI